MVVTLGQQYSVGDKPTVMLYTYINRHAGAPNKTKAKDTMSLDYSSVYNVLGCRTVHACKASSSYGVLVETK